MAPCCAPVAPLWTPRTRMRPRCSLAFEQTNGGTTVTFRGDSNPVGPFKLLSPVFNRKGQQVWDQRLARVKAVLEA